MASCCCIGGLVPSPSASRGRLSCCILWSPMPVVSAVLPLLGHLSITRCDGSALDFSESRFVSEDNLSFGLPAKYWRLEPSRARRGWDQGLDRAAALFRHRQHRILWSNCHSFVCEALNQMEYGGRADHHPLGLWLQMCRHARYVNRCSCLHTWCWFVLLLVLLLLLLLLLYCNWQ